MPTNAEIFAGPNRELNMDYIIQVAKEYRNVDIVREFNKNRTEGLIHISTVGARISRSIDAIADRDGIPRQQLKASVEGDRRRNRVAGCNQHTIVPAASPEPEAQNSTPRRATRRKSSSDAGDAVRAPTKPAPKRKRGATGGEGQDPGSQQNQRPSKKAKMTTSSASSSSAAQESSRRASRLTGPSRGSGDMSADDDEPPSPASSSSLGTKSPTPSPPTPPQDPSSSPGGPSPTAATPPRARALSTFLDDSEAHNFFLDRDQLHDDGVYALAARLTIPEIRRRANRGAGNPHTHTRTWVARRIEHAVRNLAQRRGRSVRTQWELLGDERARNGVDAAGMKRTG